MSTETIELNVESNLSQAAEKLKECRDKMPEDKPKLFSLHARIGEMAREVTERMEADHVEDELTFASTPLEFYPTKLAQLRKQICFLSEHAAEMLKPHAERIAFIKSDVWDDKAYSNEEMRKSEFERRLATWPEYQADSNEQAAIYGVIKRLSVELESTLDEFKVKRLMYERETAQIIATEIKFTTVKE